MASSVFPPGRECPPSSMNLEQVRGRGAAMRHQPSSASLPTARLQSPQTLALRPSSKGQRICQPSFFPQHHHLSLSRFLSPDIRLCPRSGPLFCTPSPSWAYPKWDPLLSLFYFPSLSTEAPGLPCPDFCLVHRGPPPPQGCGRWATFLGLLGAPSQLGESEARVPPWSCHQVLPP